MTTSDVQAGFLSSPRVSYYAEPQGDGMAQLYQCRSVGGTVSEEPLGDPAPISDVMDEVRLWNDIAETCEVDS